MGDGGDAELAPQRMYQWTYSNFECTNFGELVEAWRRNPTRSAQVGRRRGDLGGGVGAVD